jgi:hypothetical protein
MFSNNNDVWKEVARARKDDALRWKEQERQLREAGSGSASPGHVLMTGVVALVAVCLAYARKFLAL